MGTDSGNTEGLAGICDDSRENLDRELAGHHFLRIHKNYLVDQEYIKEVGKREVYLTDGKLSRHP